MAVKTPLPSLTLLDQPSLMDELTSSIDTVDLASKHVSKKVCEWFESWRPWQQRMLICGLTDRCPRHQLETLATTLEPVFHRDFVTEIRQRYPSAPFRHEKQRGEKQKKQADKEKIIAELEKHKLPLRLENDQVELELFPSFISEVDQISIANLNRISDFSNDLSSQLLDNVFSTLKSEPERFDVVDAMGNLELHGVSLDEMVNGVSPSGDLLEDEALTRFDPYESCQASPDRDRKLSLISEKQQCLARESPEARLVDNHSPSPEEESYSPHTPRPSTISDPLKKRKPKRKKPREPYVDLPPLKVIEHRHRSTVGTASDIATVDFFHGERIEKLGFMQRELRRGPVRKPNSLQALMLPLQKCYKNVKLCSDTKPYVRAHRGRLKSQFRRQLRQVWEWIRDWQDYERLGLLSDVAKLANHQMIQYLCQCLTVRLKDRIDIDSLPDQVMLRLFENLDYNDIENASQVNTRWRYLCNMDKLWQHKCKQIGKLYGIPNINHVIVRMRRNSKQIDWKLAYLEVLKVIENDKDAELKPNHVRYEESTSEGMMRIDGKFYTFSPPSDDGSSVDDRLQRPRRVTVSQIKGGENFHVRDQGVNVIDDDDSESNIDYNEYSILREVENTSKKDRRKQRSQSTYGSIFDVSGRAARYDQAKEPISDEEERDSEHPSGTKPVKRKKPRQDEQEPALDIRPELRQARDLLNNTVPSRSLVWKDSSRPDLKQKSAQFAGEVKSVQRVRKLQGHLDSVLCVGISKRRMISGSMDRSIRIWDLQTGKCIRKLYGHMGGVRCLHFEGSLLISGSWDTQAMIWDLIKFDRLAVLSGHRGSISCVGFNSKYLLTASHDKTVRVYCMRAYDLHMVIKGHTKEITSMKIDSSNVITSSSDNTVRITHIDTGFALKVFELQEHIVSLCLQNDLLIIGSGLGHCFFLNKQDGNVEAGIEAHKSSVNQVVIHANRFYTCSNDSTVKEWDLVTMTCVRVLQGPKGVLRDLKVDDRHIITCGDDGNIRIWDIHVPEHQRGSAHGDFITVTVVKGTA